MADELREGRDYRRAEVAAAVDDGPVDVAGVGGEGLPGGRGAARKLAQFGEGETVERGRLAGMAWPVTEWKNPASASMRWAKIAGIGPRTPGISRASTAGGSDSQWAMSC